MWDVGCCSVVRSAGDTKRYGFVKNVVQGNLRERCFLQLPGTLSLENDSRQDPDVQFTIARPT